MRVGNQKFLVDFYQQRRDVFARWALRQHQLGAPAAHVLLQGALLDFYDQVSDGRLTRLPPDVPAHVNQLAGLRLAAAAAPLPAAEASRRQQRLVQFHQLGPDCQRLLTYFYFHGYNFGRMSGKLGFANPAVARRQKGACLRRLVDLMDPPHGFRGHLDALERFADGALDEAAQEAFEQRLATDADLAAAHAAYEQFAADLRWAAGHDTLRLRLHLLDRRLDQRTTSLARLQRISRRHRWRSLLWAAAALLVALGTAVAWWATSRAPQREEGWATYYRLDPALALSTGQARSRPLLAQALAEYRAGHYPTALHTLGRLSPNEIGADTLNYYRGLFLLQSGNNEAAQLPLHRLAQVMGGPLARRALYHLGMAYWRAQQPAAARDALRRVAADSLNPYQTSALRVLAAGELDPRP
ncbi:hypothetical protein BEN49_02265 [Hymenobacter coccineus]|uniref:Tetratricopeptide repeat protein n=1 Tax=Hymenobacter coccineus TaxID=1908235 RepID=A0A1G1SY70_9BACT|nr:hypothetical protein BEN49_02265 [Hymenobacter coccineus]